MDCPTCGRRLTAPKTTVNKKLTQDLARAEKAIHILRTYSHVSASQAEANDLERQRMERALVDHKLLWSIYRRADKASGYKGVVDAPTPETFDVDVPALAEVSA